MNGLVLWAGLLAGNVAAASGVAYTKHANVVLFKEIQEQRRAYQRLQVDWGRLLLERGVLSAPSRIERLAERELRMHRPDFSHIRLLRP